MFPRSAFVRGGVRQASEYRQYASLAFLATNEFAARKHDTLSEKRSIAHTFADDRGNLVAKLKFADVVAIVKSPSAVVTLTLNGLSASKTVPVKD